MVVHQDVNYQHVLEAFRLGQKFLNNMDISHLMNVQQRVDAVIPPFDTAERLKVMAKDCRHQN